MKTTRSKKLWSALLALVMLLSLLPVSALADEVEGALPVESTTTLQTENDTTGDDEAEGGEPAPINEASELSLDGDISLDGDSDWTKYEVNASANVKIAKTGVSVTFQSTDTAFWVYNNNQALMLDGNGTLNATSETVGSVSLTGAKNNQFIFDNTKIPNTTDDAVTVQIPSGAIITRAGNESITGGSNTKVLYNATKDVLWLVEGSGTIGGTGDTSGNLQVKVSVSDTAYHLIAVPAAEKGNVTVQKTEAGTVVTLKNSGETFSVGEATYTAASNGAEFTIGADGSVTLTSGSASLADGESVVGGGSGKTITNPVNSSNDTITVTVGEDKDTVAMSGTINGKVTINSVEYTAAKETIIEVAKDGGNTLTSGSVGLAKDVGIHIGSLPITNKGENGGYVLVSVSSSNGNTAFIPKSGKVTIGENEIENPDDEDALMLGIDGDAMLHVAARVTINGVTYTPLTDGSSSLPLNGGKLTKAGEKAAVPGGLANDVAMAIGGGEAAPVIVVSKTNKNVTTVDYVSTGIATVEFAKKGDSFTYTSNDKTITFTAGTDNALFTLDFEDNNVFITDGSATLTDGNAVLGGGSGQRFENPASSGNDEILVTAVMPEDGKDTVTVPAGGKVKINSTVYEAGRNGVTLVVDTEGEVSVTAGSLKSDDDSAAATDTKPKGDKVAKTGDESNMALWVALALLATCAVVTTTVVAKKKSYNR